MNREMDRYLVIKRSDLKAAMSAGLITPEEHTTLVVIRDKLMFWRAEQGKHALLRCVVVEQDWPEYEPVWEMIASRVDAEQGSPPTTHGGTTP